MPNWAKCGHVEPNDARECITCLKLENRDLREKMVEIHKLLFAPGPGTATPEVNIDKAWTIAGGYAEKQPIEKRNPTTGKVLCQAIREQDGLNCWADRPCPVHG